MNLERLIQVAFDRIPTMAQVQEAAAFERLSENALLDAFARRVTERYLDGTYTFGDADLAMNCLFAYAKTITGVGLPEFAGTVFDASDAGEFLRAAVPEDQQGEHLTRRLLLDLRRTT